MLLTHGIEQRQLEQRQFERAVPAFEVSLVPLDAMAAAKAWSLIASVLAHQLAE